MKRRQTGKRYPVRQEAKVWTQAKREKLDKKQSGFFLGKVCLIEEVWFLMVRVRCEPICGIWRYMLQAWHNKLEACRTLMGKVAGCKLRCVVDYTYLSLLPSFLPSLHASSGYLYSAFLRCCIHGCKTRLCRILRQRWNVPTELFTFPCATPPSFFSSILLACEQDSLCTSIFLEEKILWNLSRLRRESSRI